ncbi:MAG: gamma-glutamyltransferase, partial [Myxococcota bacterium]
MRRGRLRYASLFLCSLVAVVAVARPALAAFPRPARGQHGMVASAHPLATSVGVEVLRQGGNAVDATCAMLGATCT